MVIHTVNLPNTDIAIQNKSNDYLIDRKLQKSGESYTGMRGLSVQDCAIQESMGPIADRSIEHLGISDTAIIQIRKLLLESLRNFADGKVLPGLDPASYRAKSTRFSLPSGESFVKAIELQLKESA